MKNEPRIIKETSAGYFPMTLEDDMLSNRMVSCVGEIDDEMVNSLISQLLYLHRNDPEAEITMLINSPGGVVGSGLALYDVMQSLSNPIRTVTTGLAASMASLIFMSGEKGRRDIFPRSRILIHDPLINQTGGSALRLKAISDDLMQSRRIISEIIARHSGKSPEEVLLKTVSDTYFTAEEAIDFGIADNIITSIGKEAVI